MRIWRVRANTVAQCILNWLVDSCIFILISSYIRQQRTSFLSTSDSVYVQKESRKIVDMTLLSDHKSVELSLKSFPKL